MEEEVFHYIEVANDEVSLNELYYILIGNELSYEDLWVVIKLLIIPSQGNASVESGFSLKRTPFR